VPGPRLGRQFGGVLLPGHHGGGPDASHLLLERFISRERKEPPDIDVDFEHERREEVIQYIYGKYGRERRHRGRGHQLPHAQRHPRRRQGAGHPEPLVDAFAKDHFWFDDAGA
jgi:error-prone DNA polymerase